MWLSTLPFCAGQQPPPRPNSGADILWFAGDANDKEANEAENVNHIGVFKIINPSLPIREQFKVDKMIPSPQRQNPPPGKTKTVDLFCSGHALLEDGRLLVTGGTETGAFRLVGVPISASATTRQS